MNKKSGLFYRAAQSIYKKLFFRSILNKQIKNFNGLNSISEWIKKGKPTPPPASFKQQFVKELQKKINNPILIETGTFMGDMIMANVNDFKKIYSIEIQPSIYKEAKKRFKKYNHVTLLLGNSITHLKSILNSKHDAAIYWLDSHFSGGVTGKSDKDTPIVEELGLIFGKMHPNDVILIDDARYFNGSNDYPTLEGLKKLVSEFNKELKFKVEDDIIIISTSNLETKFF
jgi:hypothetical protein